MKLPPPCRVCGAVEQEVTPGIWKITHDFSAHGITPPPRAPRMEPEEFFGIPRFDFSRYVEQEERA